MLVTVTMQPVAKHQLARLIWTLNYRLKLPLLATSKPQNMNVIEALNWWTFLISTPYSEVVRLLIFFHWPVAGSPDAHPPCWIFVWNCGGLDIIHVMHKLHVIIQFILDQIACRVVKASQLASQSADVLTFIVVDVTRYIHLISLFSFAPWGWASRLYKPVHVADCYFWKVL